MIIASETDRFGQQETQLRVIPGAGGTQGLTKSVALQGMEAFLEEQRPKWKGR